MQIKQASEAEWKEVCNPIYLCTLNLYPLDMIERYGIEFFKFEEQGLGLLCASVIRIDNSMYWLFSSVDESGNTGLVKDDPDFLNINREAIKVSVNIRSYEKDSKVALALLCDALGITKDDLYECSEYLGPAKWRLSRLDDNGNEVEMFRFLNENCANWLRQKYEGKGHRQAYFVHELMLSEINN